MNIERRRIIWDRAGAAFGLFLIAVCLGSLIYAFWSKEWPWLAITLLSGLMLAEKR